VLVDLWLTQYPGSMWRYHMRFIEHKQTVFDMLHVAYCNDNDVSLLIYGFTLNPESYSYFVLLLLVLHPVI